MILLSEGIYYIGIARFTKCVKFEMLAIKLMGCLFCWGTVHNITWNVKWCQILVL